MKKSILSIVLLLTAMMLTATPNVTITVDTVTPTTITCSFDMNEDCVSYFIVASKPEDIEPWVGTPFGGATLEETVEQFGIEYTADDTYTWTDMEANTMYVIYVTAKDSEGTRVLCQDTAYTPKGGGSGESVITLKVEDVTESGAKLTATPNDQTVLFYDMVMATFVKDSIYAYYFALDSATAEVNTNDSIYRALLIYGAKFYQEDSYKWSNLYSGTDYLFVARGMNADSVWGELVYAPFKTLGTPAAVENVEMNAISVYPNPATDYIIIEGVADGEAIEVIDLRGNVLVETTDAHISVADFVPGVYFVRTAAGVNKFIVR